MNASRRRLRVLVTSLGLVAAIAATVLVPAGYFSVAVSHSLHELQFTARLKANRLAKYIYANEELWQYQTVRLAELIEMREASETDHHQSVFDAAGKLVLETGVMPDVPIISSTAPIIVAGVEVGRVENTHSLRPPLIHTGLVALLSGMLGFAMFFAMRMLPLRAIDRTFAALDRQTALFETALDNMSQGLCMFDAEQNLVVANKRFFELFGIPAEALTPGMSREELMRASIGIGFYRPGERPGSRSGIGKGRRPCASPMARSSASSASRWRMAATSSPMRTSPSGAGARIETG